MNTQKVYIVIASLQLILFSIYMYRISRIKNVEENKTIDIIDIVTYNGKTYWMENGKLTRATSLNNRIDITTCERVGTKTTKDLTPVEIIYILNELERVE